MKVTPKLLQNMSISLIYISLIGLLLSWVLPWMVRPYPEYDYWFIRFNMSELENQSFYYIFDYVVYTELAFFGALICGLFVKVGVAMKNKSKKLSNYLMLGIIPNLAFSIIAVAFSVWTIFRLTGINDSSYEMGFNYGPLMMSVVLLIVSAIMTVMVVPRSLKSLKREKEKAMDHGPMYPNGQMMNQPMNQPVDQQTNQPMTQPYDDQQVPEQPSNLRCPQCGDEHDEEVLVCSSCDANLSKKCPSCEMLVNINVQECPQCGFDGSDTVGMDDVKDY